jgi:hypothetical protein
MTPRFLRTSSIALALASALTFTSASAFAQSGNAQSGNKSGSMTGHGSATATTHDMSQPNPAGAHTWNENQIVTATVHQAWQLAGRDENNFFEIVRQLAEISARNRNVELPDDPAAGKRAGQYIRQQAKADHDQLLYSIVDKAVRMTSKKSPATATASTGH